MYLNFFQLPQVGPKFLFMTGIFVAGLCNLLFGYVYLYDIRNTELTNGVLLFSEH